MTIKAVERFIEKINERNNITKFEKFECLNPEAVINYYEKTNNMFVMKCDKNHQWTEAHPNRLYVSDHRCPECAKLDKLYKRQLKALQKCNDKHNNAYEYKYFMNEYEDTNSTITVTCKEHGDFNIIFSKHISPPYYGCQECSKLKRQAKFRISDEYISLFKEMNLELTDLSSNSNTHQNIKCLQCNNIFNATPKSKVSNYRKYGVKGCPECTYNERYKESREKNEALIRASGYEILSPLLDTHGHLHVRNMNCSCGRSWWAKPINLINNGTVCRPCNDDRKREFFIESGKKRTENAMHNKEGFEKYEYLVNKYTKESIKDKTTNHELSTHDPMQRGREHNVELDHIVPIVYGFKHDIPSELIGHIDNIRYIDKTFNVIKNKNVTTRIPSIFDEYLTSNKITDEFITEISKIKSPITVWEETPYGSYHLNYGKIKIRLALFDEVGKSVSTGNMNKNIYNFCNSNNDRLILIFEDEWTKNKDIVLDNLIRILHKDQLNNSFDIKDCIFKEIDMTTKNQFLSDNYFNITDRSNILLGAFLNNELISVLCIDDTGTYRGKGTPYISEFVMKLGYINNDVFNHMLEIIEDKYNINEFLFYDDLKWSKIYDLNFDNKTLLHTALPTRSYSKNGNRYNKSRFSSDNLKKMIGEDYDSTLTEFEYAQQYEFDQINDCGKNLYKVIL